MSLADKINQLNLIKTKFKDLDIEYQTLLTDLQNEHNTVDHYSKMFKDNDNFEKLIDINKHIRALLVEHKNASKKLQSQIDTVIHRKETVILQHDYDRYSKQIVTQDVLDIRNHSLSRDVVDILTTEIYNVSDWKFAACIINPFDSTFVKQMVSFEPLYILSSNPVHIKRSVKKFNKFYQKNRLRIYSRMNELPRCLYFSVCINQFEYMPLDDQGKIMKEVFRYSLPGAKFLITFNDCDERASLEHTLQGLRFYNTKQLVLGKAFSIGWDVFKTGKINNGMWNYAVLKKPGVATSIKTAAPMVENIKSPVVEMTKAEREADYLKRTQENLRLKAQGKIK